jgi:hypothetical protein
LFCSFIFFERSQKDPKENYTKIKQKIETHITSATTKDLTPIIDRKDYGGRMVLVIEFKLYVLLFICKISVKKLICKIDI